MEQMAIMEVSGCNLAGFSPVASDDLILRDTVVHRAGDHLALRFIIGQVRIFRNQGLPIQLLDAVGKSDYELSCRYFQADGGVIRSQLAIRCRKYLGGVATQSHMAEALVLRKHFPREIPIAPKVHAGGTTAFKLASVTLGQDAILEKLKHTMKERLGDAVCKVVIKQVEFDMVESKKLLSSTRASRKRLSESQRLQLAREDYNALMIARHGEGFDDDSHMLPFPSFVSQRPGHFKRVRSQLEERPNHGRVQCAKPCKALPRKKEKALPRKLRSSSEILQHAINLATAGDKHDDVENKVETHMGNKSTRQQGVCKACGGRGHYEKGCPVKGPRALETPYERQQRYNASRRAKYITQKTSGQACVQKKRRNVTTHVCKKPAMTRQA